VDAGTRHNDAVIKVCEQGVVGGEQGSEFRDGEPLRRVGDVAGEPETFALQHLDDGLGAGFRPRTPEATARPTPDRSTAISVSSDTGARPVVNSPFPTTNRSPAPGRHAGTWFMNPVSSSSERSGAT
jgi:hypothetical protein